MIVLQNLCKSFATPNGRKHVARGLNLTLPKGQAVALLGRNGAGKSTLLQMISGSMDPDSGQVITHGSVSFPVGFAGSFHRDMTGAQNARFVARIYGVDSDALLDFVADFASLGSHLYMPVRSYSSGMRARFTFALLLALDFDIYLVDEGMPSSTDVEFNRKAGEVLRERLRTTTMIIVSHQPKTLEKFARSAAVLLNGQLHMFDTLEEAKQLYDYQTKG